MFLTRGGGFVFDTTSTMSVLNDAKLKDYQLVMMLNMGHEAQIF